MSNEVKKVNPTKVITSKNVRFSYLNVWEPKAINENSTPKYSVSLIISKDDKVTLEKVKKAIEAAYKEGEYILRGNGKTVPPLESLKTPLRDGDIDRNSDPAYANSYFINANSITAPGLVNSDCDVVLDHSEFYSGIYGRASISFYAYSNSGARGIACGLNNLQKIRDGEPLGNRSTPESDFAEDSEDDDFLE